MDTAKQLVWIGRAAAALYFVSSVVPWLVPSTTIPSYELLFGIRAISLLTASMMVAIVVTMAPRENMLLVDRTIALVLLADALASLVIGHILFNWEQLDALSMYYRVKVATFILCKSLIAVGILRGWRIAHLGLVLVMLLHLGSLIPAVNPDSYFAPIFYSLPMPKASGSIVRVEVVQTSTIATFGNVLDNGIIGVMLLYSFALRGRRTLGDHFGINTQPAS